MDERAFEMAQQRAEEEREAAIAARVRYAGQSRADCIDCDEPIPEKRRVAIPGVERCVDCQQLQEVRHV